MKNLNKILLLASLIGLASCDDEGEVYTGSPLDNPNIAITPITAVIETIPADAATNGIFLTDQKIPIKITLPRQFADTVQVEATSLASNGRRRRGYIEFLPYETVQTGDVLAAGGDIFNDNFQLSATAIELYNGEPGKHYLLNSNVITVNSGSTTVPDNDVNKLQIKLAWPEAGPQKNNLRLNIDRPDPITDAAPNFFPGSVFKIHSISNSSAPGTNNPNQSAVAGEYIIRIGAQRLISTPNPSDMQYRLIINLPNDTVKVFQGVYTNLYANDPATPANEESPLLPIAKIVKTINGDGSVSFTVEQL